MYSENWLFLHRILSGLFRKKARPASKLAGRADIYNLSVTNPA